MSAEEASKTSDSVTELEEEANMGCVVWRITTGVHVSCVVLCERQQRATVARNWMSWKTKDPKTWVKVTNNYYFTSLYRGML